MDPANPNQPENPSQTNTPVSPENPTIVQPPTIDIPEPAPPPTVPGPELPPVTPTEPIMDTHGNVAAPPVLEPMQTSEVHNSSGGDSKKYFKLAGYVFIGIAVLIAAYLAAAKFYLYTWPFTPPVQETVLKKPVASPMTSPSSVGNPITADWKSYTFKSVGLQFKVPASMTNVGDFSEHEDPGETGSSIMMYYTVRPGRPTNAENVPYNLRFGGVSKDFSIGRGGVITDTNGYIKKENKYFNKFGSIESEIISPNISVTEVETLLGKVLKIKQIKPSDDSDESINAYELGMDTLAAFVNTGNDKYPGIVISMTITDDMTEKEFDLILSTLEKVK